MASAGDLDTGFAGNGKKAISFGGTDEARAVLVQPNGRIVVAGTGGASRRFCVARLRNNGLLDTTFGSGGKRKIDFGGGEDQAFAVALQPDGKIVVAGDSHVQQVAVTRLNANGSLDATFSADGKQLFSWGVVSRATAVGRAAQPQAPARRLLRPRGREHPGGAAERQRRARHHVRHRRDRHRRPRRHRVRLRDGAPGERPHPDRRRLRRRRRRRRPVADGAGRSTPTSAAAT